jgi:hypothetical protein
MNWIAALKGAYQVLVAHLAHDSPRANKHDLQYTIMG